MQVSAQYESLPPSPLSELREFIKVSNVYWGRLKPPGSPKTIPRSKPLFSGALGKNQQLPVGYRIVDEGCYVFRIEGHGAIGSAEIVEGTPSIHNPNRWISDEAEVKGEVIFIGRKANAGVYWVCANGTIEQVVDEEWEPNELVSPIQCAIRTSKRGLEFLSLGTEPTIVDKQVFSH